VYLKIHGSPFQGKAFDLIVVSRGVPFAIELKRPGGKPTPAQVNTLMQWESAGANVAVIDNLKDFITLLNKPMTKGRAVAHT
jgi:hypothetical protein